MFARLLACLFAASVAVAQSPSRDVSFGEWPFLVGNMDAQIPQLVADARANDIDTIYINVFRATGPSTGTMWVTDVAGTWNPTWGAVRQNGSGIQLVELIRAAHAQNLQVVAVVKCFDSTVPPTDAAHRAYLLDVIEYFTNSYAADGKPVYDLDGIALDYVRFVGGTNHDPAVVTDFVRDVKARIAPLSLHAYLIAGRYTFDGPTYDAQFNSYASVLAANARDYGQHWEQMARHVDVMMPMAYTADGSIYATAARHRAYVQQVASYCRTACARAGFPTRRVVNTIRTYSDASETATDVTVEASIVGSLNGGADGYQAFRYGTLRPNAGWWTKLRQYAVPGPNRPIPVLTTATNGLTVVVNGLSSRDFDEPSSNLRFRFDWNGDGVFDTGSLPNVLHSALGRRDGTVRVGVELTDSDGLVATTTRRVAFQPPLSSDVATLSAVTGGAVQLRIDAGIAAAGLTYVMLGTASGTTPGLPLPQGFVLPLNYDAITATLVQAISTPVFANAVGVLDASGRATTTFAVPPGVVTVLAGRTLHFAGVGVGPFQTYRFTTNATPVSIVP
jgi:hypothetical protein